MDKYFKTSKKSICHECFNLNTKCSKVEKSCGTDSKIGQSFVYSCSLFNKEKNSIEHSDNKISAMPADSRIEMMGGGFQNIEKYKDFNNGPT